MQLLHRLEDQFPVPDWQGIGDAAPGKKFTRAGKFRNVPGFLHMLESGRQGFARPLLFTMPPQKTSGAIPVITIGSSNVRCTTFHQELR
jgi:hypothetical protein